MTSIIPDTTFRAMSLAGLEAQVGRDLPDNGFVQHRGNTFLLEKVGEWHLCHVWKNTTIDQIVDHFSETVFGLEGHFNAMWKLLDTEQLKNAAYRFRSALLSGGHRNV